MKIIVLESNILDAKDNKIGIEGCTWVCEAMKSNRALTTLYLNGAVQ